MTKYEANTLIDTYKIPRNKDFYTLSTDDVERVLIVADLVHYKMPVKPIKPRAYYFYEYLMKCISD